MYKVWDGSQWDKTRALKVWTGSLWKAGYKFKVRTATSWLPSSISDKDDSQIIKWSVQGPTPPPPPPPVTHIVPDLDLKTLEEVQALLDPLVFYYEVNSFVNTSIAEYDNKVVIDSQNPPAGESLAEEGTITFNLYNFVQPTTTVPNLDNLLTSQANTAITNADLVVSTNLGTEETYDNTKIGRVIVGSQYPTAGDTVDTGTEVTYDYYIQKPYTNVPNLVGQDESNVFTLLNNANLTIGTRTVVATADSTLDNKVKSTYPVFNTQVQQDSSVDYEVYEHSLAVVPNLNGLTQTQAENALQNVGLYVGNVANEETTYQYLEDTVKPNSQFPSANTTTQLGNSVNFTVYVPNTTIAVPYVIGLTTTQATSAAQTAELNLQLRNVTYTNDTNQHLKVYAQSPNANTIVNVNSTLYVDIYLPYPTYTVPSIIGLTPSSAGTAINSNFTWGSNTLTNTSTETTSNFGKVSQQNPSANTQAQAGSINYGIYVDGRPTVPNVVGQTEATAKTNINNAGLNWSVTYQNQTYSGQATAGTVASQGTTAGTRVASGTTIAIVVWNAYTAQPVTRNAVIYFGDDGENGYYYNGTRNYTASGSVDWTWQAGYKLMATTGTRTNSVSYQTTTFDIGTNPAATSNGKNGAAFKFNRTNLESWIKSTVTGNQNFTTDNLTLYIDTGAVGDDGTTWFVGYYTGGAVTSAPLTLTDSNTQNLIQFTKYTSWQHALSISGTNFTNLYTNQYPLVIHQGVNSSSTTRWGRVNKVWYAMGISWTEYV